MLHRGSRAQRESVIHQQKVRRLLEKELHGRSIDMNALLMDAQIVIKEGVRMRHGAKVKLCSIEGCTNQAQKGGVCVKHGAKKERKQGKKYI
jgi:hypothetical protein